MTNDPQVKLFTNIWPALRVREMNAIRLKFKSDGNAYTLSLNQKSSISWGSNATCTILDESKEWQSLEIPISSMKLEDATNKDLG